MSRLVSRRLLINSRACLSACGTVLSSRLQKKENVRSFLLLGEAMVLKECGFLLSCASSVSS